jgi:hypothetical protein
MRLDPAAFRHRHIEAPGKKRRRHASRGKAAHQIHRVTLEPAAVFQRIAGKSDFHHSAHQAAFC